MRRICLISLIVLSITFQTFASDAQYYYVMKKDQNVSSIIYRMNLSPIYGRKGALTQIAIGNPSITDINKVRPQQKILFPKDLTERAISLGTIGVTETNQITLFESKVVDTVDSSNDAPKEDNSLSPGKSEPAESYSQFEVQLRSYFLRQNGSDQFSNAALISKLSFDLDLSWKQIWTSSFLTFVEVGIGTSEINKSNSKKINNRHHQLSKLGAGITYKPLSNIELSTALRQEEQMFYRASSPTELSVDSVTTSALDFEWRHHFFHKNPLSAGYFLSGRYLAPISSSYFNSNSWRGYGAGFLVKHDAKRFSLIAELSYHQQEVQFESLQVQNSEVGTSLRLLWNWGAP